MSADALAMSATWVWVRSHARGAAGSVVNPRPLTASDYRATRKFAKTAFGRTAFLERGSGRAALFLHGFPLNSFQWRGLLTRLSGHRRCVAPDFMGLGYTEVNEGQSVAPVAQVKMLAAVLDSLSISA